MSRLLGRLQRGVASAGIPMLLAAALVVLLLAPVRSSALRFDDARVIVENQGQRIAEGLSIADQLETSVRSMVEGQGRPQPLGVIQGTLLQALVPERAPYKVVLIVISALCVAGLLALLRMLGLPRRALPIAGATLAVCLQYRSYHDPILGYYGTTQFSILLLLGGLAAYLRFLRGGGVGWFALAVVLAVMMLTAYEANYPLVAAFVCLHLGRDPRRTRGLGWSSVFLGLGAAMVVLAAYTHGRAPVIATGYETSLDAIAAIQATARQVFAPFPAIYFVSGGGGQLASPTIAEVLGALLRAALAAGVVVAMVIGARRLARPAEGRRVEPERGEEETHPPQYAVMVALGVVLIVAPVLLLSLAAKYQTEIPIGGGYLPTLIQVLGAVAIAAAAWGRFGQAVSHRPVVAAAVVLLVGVGTLATQYTNLRVIALEIPGREQRDLLETALELGVLAEVPQSSTVFFSQRDLNWPRGNIASYPGTIDYLVLDVSGRRTDVRAFPPVTTGCNPPIAFPVSDCAPVGASATWLLVRGHRFGGSVIRADVAGSSRADTRAPAAITVLARGTSGRDAAPSLVGTTAQGAPWEAGQGRWDRRALAGGWVRYTSSTLGSSRPVAATLTDPRSTVDFTLPEVGGQAVRQFGTKELLP